MRDVSKTGTCPAISRQGGEEGRGRGRPASAPVRDGNVQYLARRYGLYVLDVTVHVYVCMVWTSVLSTSYRSFHVTRATLKVMAAAGPFCRTS